MTSSENNTVAATVGFININTVGSTFLLLTEGDKTAPTKKATTKKATTPVTTTLDKKVTRESENQLKLDESSTWNLDEKTLNQGLLLLPCYGWLYKLKLEPGTYLRRLTNSSKWFVINNGERVFSSDGKEKFKNGITKGWFAATNPIPKNNRRYTKVFNLVEEDGYFFRDQVTIIDLDNYILPSHNEGKGNGKGKGKPTTTTTTTNTTTTKKIKKPNATLAWGKCVKVTNSGGVESNTTDITGYISYVDKGLVACVQITTNESGVKPFTETLVKKPGYESYSRINRNDFIAFVRRHQMTSKGKGWKIVY